VGQEAKCSARFGGRTAAGKALLETEELIFRGERRLAIPFREIASCEARDGCLEIGFSGGTASFDLGPLAEKWAAKIRNPPSRLAKLGVKPGLAVSLIDVTDEAFRAEVEKSGAALPGRKPEAGWDILFFGAERRANLARLEKLKAGLAPAGAIWVIRPKGTKEITDADVIAAGKAAGLVDVKVAAFSKTHTAEKLVIPLAKRAKACKSAPRTGK
jgi:hypothetical protein